jgi:hypothetical protein
MSNTELYRVVLTFTYANGPKVVPSQPRSKSQALRLWRWHTASGTFTPHSHLRARVMTDREFRKVFPQMVGR